MQEESKPHITTHPEDEGCGTYFIECYNCLKLVEVYESLHNPDEDIVLCKNCDVGQEYKKRKDYYGHQNVLLSLDTSFPRLD
jgi:hypothetical protein